MRLRARLREARRILSARLVELYQTPQPDLVTVIMRAKGFADLLEQSTYVKAIGHQDQRIIDIVQDRAGSTRRRRSAASPATRRASRTSRRAIEARRNALVGISASLQQRRAAVAQARGRAGGAARRDARAARSGSRSGSRRSRRRGRAPRRSSGPGGPWAIPWPIVQCESGGQNLPPNYAGASGYYQILPSTWKLFGGSGPAAWKASKAEQDRVASRRSGTAGAGAHNWVCAALVA